MRRKDGHLICGECANFAPEYDPAGNYPRGSCEVEVTTTAGGPLPMWATTCVFAHWIATPCEAFRAIGMAPGPLFEAADAAGGK